MKVLHVVPSLGSIYGGPSVSVINLAKALGEIGLDVDIITTNVNGQDTLDVPLETWVQHEHLRIQYFSCWHFKDYKISNTMSAWLYQNIDSYDIVNTHAIFSVTNAAAYRACQRRNIPYVIHPHGMLEGWALNYKSWKKRPYYSFIEKSAIARASMIRVLAKAEADSLKELNLGSPLTLIPNGVEKSEFIQMPDRQEFDHTFPETNGKRLILFLGRIDPKKGLDLLAEAFSQINQRFSDTHLVIAGPDNTGFRAVAESYFAKFNCLAAVTFTGMLEGSLKYSALSAATLYTAPSYSEGFSMSVLEGMAAGLPCVITTGCNFPEAAEASAAYVVPIQAAAIAEACMYCLSDPGAAEMTGQRARKLIFDHYSWNAIAQKMLAAYKSILEEKTLVTASSCH
jgi:glycosyltransferase involved in cell wall biosynthesis